MPLYGKAKLLAMDDEDSDSSDDFDSIENISLKHEKNNVIPPTLLSEPLTDKKVVRLNE